MATEFSAIRDAMVYGVLVVAVFIVAGLGVLYLRARLFKGSSGEEDNATLGSLESLRQKGLLTDEEFRRIRRKAIERRTAAPVQDQDRPSGAVQTDLSAAPDSADPKISAEARPPSREDHTE